MVAEISYFDVASFLAEIEAEYAEISDPIERTQQLVMRLQEKWPALTASQAVAYIRGHCHVNRFYSEIAVNCRWSPYAFSMT